MSNVVPQLVSQTTITVNDDVYRQIQTDFANIEASLTADEKAKLQVYQEEYADIKMQNTQIGNMHRSDGDRIYYKITNEDEKHFGFRYHDGYNFDTTRMDPEQQCGSGLYFTNKDQIWNFREYGTNMRYLRVPKNLPICEYYDDNMTIQYNAPCKCAVCVRQLILNGPRGVWKCKAPVVVFGRKIKVSSDEFFDLVYDSLKQKNGLHSLRRHVDEDIEKYFNKLSTIPTTPKPDISRTLERLLVDCPNFAERIPDRIRYLKFLGGDQRITEYVNTNCDFHDVKKVMSFVRYLNGEHKGKWIYQNGHRDYSGIPYDGNSFQRNILSRYIDYMDMQLLEVRVNSKVELPTQHEHLFVTSLRKVLPQSEFDGYMNATSTNDCTSCS
jgi:hypothetical protein